MPSHDRADAPDIEFVIVQGLVEARLPHNRRSAGLSSKRAPLILRETIPKSGQEPGLFLGLSGRCDFWTRHQIEHLAALLNRWLATEKLAPPPDAKEPRP